MDSKQWTLIFWEEEGSVSTRPITNIAFLFCGRNLQSKVEQEAV